MRIAALCRSAMELGLRTGLTLADARARFPDIDVAEDDPTADSTLIDQMLEDCDRWTMLVGRDDPHGLMLDITGCAHLFGGEMLMRRKIIARFNRAGFDLTATIAGTPDAARALARYGRSGIVRDGEEAAVVRPLPVAALEMPEDARLALSRAGLKTVGDLADRPSQPLAARFSEVLTAKLHRVLGQHDIRITPYRAPPACVVERLFPEPVATAETIQLTLRRLVARVAVLLEKRGDGGRMFEASFYRTDGAVRRITVGTGRPTRDGRIVMRLFDEKIDTLADPIDPGFGFDLIRLAVPATEPFENDQPSFDGKVAEEQEVTDLIDRLVARFGADAVLRFVAADTHDPLRAARLIHASGNAAVAIAWPETEPDEPPTRPLRLFDPPEPIDTFAEVPDGPPIRFRWRHVLHDVTRAEGPERIASEWWRKTHVPTRDYFRVEDAAGRRFWVFREGYHGAEGETPRWFLHGLFA
ncbi:DNA polymerase IV [Variibacter gotjawalensis]|uniref:DNA polymerase IV n=2 Tax=Variibacter gotjawalensis TaxID=1333996 RepID=A0A0S3PRK2_9BRAD|nr:DNA polymerase Y family protein [Variibacter gotjawalensis]RZS50687.1 protein ImuB [Variibacter gotjawalensis]BAT58521.1 DNA polymerase IV [Variibacter gotjawalensis]